MRISVVGLVSIRMVGAALLAAISLVLLSARAEATTIVDTFDADSEGWYVVNNGEPSISEATWNPTGGNPGGFISAVDAYNDDCSVGDCKSVIFAPVLWGPPGGDGDHAENYGGRIEFDLMTSTTPTRSVELTLRGPDHCVLQQLGLPGVGTWKSFSVSLTEAGWTDCISGPSPDPASEEYFRATLASVSEVLIDADAVFGTGETISLDNASLLEPEPERFARTLTLKYRGGKFRGQLGASEPACKAGEKVDVYKRKTGPDRRLGSPETGDDGKYSLRKPRKPGKYYAKTAEHTEPEGICEAAKSKVLTLR